MARRTKLKVFRTPIGFHDAYVAAPSQKAALEAWGSNADLFARGSAELVTDDDLTREPLAHPGTVIKRLRGSPEDHIAALPKNRPRSRKKDTAPDDAQTRVRSAPGKRSTPRPPTPPPPRPSRAGLDRSEKALDDLKARQEKEDKDLRHREDEIKREREQLDRAQERKRASAERAVERERQKHSTALADWSAKLSGS